MSAATRRLEPIPAERARSLLETARSLTIVTESRRVERVGLRAVDPSGRLALADPVDDRLRVEVARAREGELVGVAEVTDVAPTPVRDRVRARLTLGGHLTAADGRQGGALCFVPERAALREAGRTVPLGVDQLALARPDPLASYEADLLANLDAARTGIAARLARLLPSRHLVGVVRVRPVRIDRYGLVLRLERTRTDHDARLGFPSPVSHPGKAVREIRSLLARAATSTRGPVCPCPAGE
ncbi:DUF2470 domain-containing protein [Streptomyces tagetis]|uniref:DUF2470 domain-containing protein n=1 Tax=Streptomyces tagetis TaxID=2820809 RepID=A0A940XB29_9ACTN|nr:DUF2470 domain-containing protein [Streptomyces sp. RG38]MBQ0825274.1 DUF2470 domain-containing protein [Streptomyces sp. RG38]